MPDPAIEVGIHARFAQVSGMDLITREVERAAEKFKLNPRAFSDLENAVRRAGKQYSDFVAKARPVGMAKEVEQLTAKWQDLQRSLADDVLRAAKVEAAIKNATLADERAALKEQLKAIKKEAEAKSKQLEAELRAADEIASRRSEGLRAMQEALSIDKWEGVKSGANLAEGFAKGLSRLEPSDLKGMVSALSGGLKKAGGLLEGIGGARAAAGAAGGEALAGIGARLAAMAGPIGALGAAVSALVGMFFVLDTQTKDFNKALMQGAGAADFMYRKSDRSMRALTYTLDQAREAAMEQALAWREQPEEIMKILAAANEAGLTYREMAERLNDAGNSLRAYIDLTEVALKYSRTLGVSTDEIAQTTATWMHDFGGGLRVIEEGFTAIFTASQESGIGVKRFFGMVTQATSGMALYNVRIDETAALIANLSKSLGEVGAADFVSSLQKGFSAESYQERYKQLMLTPGGARREIINLNAGQALKTFAEAVASSTSKEGIGRAFGNVGLSYENIARGGPGAFKALRGLSAKDTRSLIAQVMEQDPALGRKLQTALDAVEGTSGRLGDMAKALDALSAGGTLAMRVTTGVRTVGATSVSEMTPQQLMAFEQVSGIQGEQLQQLRRMDQALRGEWELKKKRGEFTGSYNEYLMTQGDRLADALKEPMDAQTVMAQQIVQNTESVAVLLKTTIAYGLEKIADIVSSFYDAFRGFDAADTRERDALLKRLEAQREDIVAAMSATQQQLTRAEQELAQTPMGAARDRVQQRVDDLRAQLDAQKLGLSSKEAEIAKARRMNVGKRAFDWSAIFTQAGGSESQQTVMMMGGGGRDLSKPKKVVREERKTLASELADKVQAPIEAQTEAQKKAQEEEFKRLMDKYPDLTKEGYLEALRIHDVRKISQAVQAQRGLTPQAAAQLENSLLSGGTLSDADVQALLKAGYSRSFFAGYARMPPAGDFIYQGGANGGTITPISRSDQFLGVQPGGPADIRGGGNVTININGGDTAKIYSVVKRALRESSLRPSPGRKQR